MRALIPSLLLTFALSMALVRLLSSGRLAGLVLDRPNERSLHDRPIPRTGGLGLMIAAATGWWFSGVADGSAGAFAIVLIAVPLAALFLGDDIANLSVGLRFGAQLAAAVAYIALTWPYPVWLAPLLVLGIIWAMNLYNFMDGSNGLAGGMALIGFGALALGATAHAATHGTGQDIALLAGVVAAAAAGFLVWNFDPARIFLGDAGSVPLGFLAAALGILGWQRGVWPFWFPALVFAVFLVDSGLTLGKRVMRGENPLQAHRSHYYQRMIRMGWSHRRTALSAYALMLASAASALTWQHAGFRVVFVVVGLWIVVMLGLAVLIDRRWRTSQTDPA